jgi:hypothetical protein
MSAVTFESMHGPVTDPYEHWKKRHSLKGSFKVVDEDTKKFMIDLGVTTVHAIELGLKDQRLVPGQEISPRAKQVRDAIMELVIARTGLMLANMIDGFDSFEFNALCRGRKS